MPEQETKQQEVQSTEDSAATLTRPAPARPKPDRKVKELPPFKVLLHNDDVNTVDHVIMSVMKLTGMQLEDAVQKTLEAHETGVALLLVTHQERAELYQEQFATFQITVTAEPA